MLELNKKVSYLRGLAEGMEINEDTKEGKIFINIIDLLEEMVLAISELETAQAEMEEYIDNLDEDLADIEHVVFENEKDEWDNEDTQYIEVECPKCKETVYFDEEIFEDDEEDLVCPNCNEVIYSEESYEISEDID
ncbi:MAG: CD1247 N-terminal domain-containing protein [Caldicoprobacterales bacterium]|jgi:formylmethanofuran dehydrogenase subunit E|nr:hypothetical protein [Clostridiales bacterium]